MNFYDTTDIPCFGVAGNFTGHLEQAGEAADFKNVKTLEQNAPKAIFPTFLPLKQPNSSKDTSVIPEFLTVFPFDANGFCFKADSVNGKLNMGLIEYEKIKSVDYKRTFGIIPNGLLVVLKDGTEMAFVPLKRKQVKDFLCSRIIK